MRPGLSAFRGMVTPTTRFEHHGLIHFKDGSSGVIKNINKISMDDKGNVWVVGSCRAIESIKKPKASDPTE
jgi:hypothetical protein